MEILTTILATLAIIVVLVLVHEVGHFVVAKLSGITVQEFGIGFPPRIASLIWRGTRYSVNWIPLGGFVKMLGEDGDAEAERMRKQGLSETAVDRAMEGAFNRKPIPLRLAVLLAGVAMNFLLAVILLGIAAAQPQPDRVAPITVTEVQPDSPAEGVLAIDDRIVAADGRTYDRAADLLAYIQSRAGSEVELTIERGGGERLVTVTPRILTDEQRQAGVGPVGFAWDAEVRDFPPLADGPGEALAFGLDQSWTTAVQIPGALGRTVAGLIGLAPNTGDARGPIGIAQLTGEVLQQPLVVQLYFVALLSINLAVLNVMPFPPLDGGRIAVTLVEAARRRRLPAASEAFIYAAGFVFLIALVVLISIQDLSRPAGT
ncbi:MAG TPA: M50 family metallopeptidase [Candidatus Limnocylindria bacterium]|nr:M50 family metallopeptidase [Candidatus Limnocylindria bacterium]